MSTPSNSIASYTTTPHWTTNTNVNDKHVDPHSEKNISIIGNQVKYSVANSDSKSSSVTNFIVYHRRGKDGSFNVDLYQKMSSNETRTILKHLPDRIVAEVKRKAEAFKTKSLVGERVIAAIEPEPEPKAKPSKLSTEISLRPMTREGQYATFDSSVGSLVFEVKWKEGRPAKLLFMNEVKEEISASSLNLGERKILVNFPVTVRIAERGKYTLTITPENAMFFIQVTEADALNEPLRN